MLFCIDALLRNMGISDMKSFADRLNKLYAEILLISRFVLGKTAISMFPIICLLLSAKFAEAGQWLTDSHTDSFDDSVSVTASTTSVDGDFAFMFITCSEGEIFFSISWDKYLNIKRGSDVTTRLDDKDSENLDWFIPNSSNTILHLGGDSLLDKISKGVKFGIRTSSYTKTITSWFDLSGIDDATEPVISACNP